MFLIEGILLCRIFHCHSGKIATILSIEGSEIIKSIFLLSLAAWIILSGNHSYALSKSTDRHPTNEEVYRDIGYGTIDKALQEFAAHFNQGIELPLRTPPISFTHTLGRFNDLDGEDKDSLEIKYINEKLPDNHYKITVRPVEHRFPYKEEDVIKVIKLQDGEEAVYLDRDGFNVLSFERGYWQYTLSINKRASDLMLPGVLVQIANSIEFANDES